MNSLLYLTMLFIVILTVVPIMIVIIKTVFRRKLPSNYYTPFDYISAQTTEEFHEEKEEIKKEDENGDSKNRVRVFIVVSRMLIMLTGLVYRIHLK
ncbi:MAG TPA: DUF3951 domain-containing protein [Ureibacillus sp.]|uniref:DUF3951 domain-containing protein n=2 Tax=Priestia TaxID=2800373 RepID=UPI0021AE6BAE|nr:DUF3951 domain-containing protein [Priestia aryabhattai]HWL24682.1 DUF3951 domain-containing protein [Ureibacillus sp.]